MRSPAGTANPSGSNRRRRSPGGRPGLARELVVAAQAAAAGWEVITSRHLAQHSRGNASQVRRALLRAGVSGKPGVGYEVDALLGKFTMWRGSGPRRLALAGSGDLAETLVRSPLLRSASVEITCVFDVDPGKVGQRVAEREIVGAADLEALIARGLIEAGVIATPPGDAQAAYDVLAGAGVRVVVNLAPTLLDVREGVAVAYPSDPAAELLLRVSSANHLDPGPSRRSA